MLTGSIAMLILRLLEEQGMINSYDENADSSRVRKYYSITKKGKRLLADKKEEWETLIGIMLSVFKSGDLVRDNLTISLLRKNKLFEITDGKLIINLNIK